MPAGASCVILKQKINPMKQLEFKPKEEIDLNDRLVNLYGSKLVGLYTDLEPLFEREGGIKPALPLLLWLHDCEAYEKADVKVMIFGRETNNWNDGRRPHLPNGTYNFDLRTNDDIIAEIMGPEGICDTYDAYCNYPEGGETNFTKRMKALVERLRRAMPGKKVEFVWNNIHKIGRGASGPGHCTGQPTAEIRDIVRNRFNVVPDEIDILRPDVVIFLTGPDADNAIADTFGVGNDAFAPVAPGLFLDRVVIPGIKYAARTIHPSRKSNEVLDSHFQALIDDIAAAFK